MRASDWLPLTAGLDSSYRPLEPAGRGRGVRPAIAWPADVLAASGKVRLDEFEEA